MITAWAPVARAIAASEETPPARPPPHATPTRTSANLADTTTAERGELTRETWTTEGAAAGTPARLAPETAPKTKAKPTLMTFIIWNFAHFPLY
ncbi:MAG: hypothetical protein Fur0036_05080 [Fimbriimonadaceae bacterium]